MCVANRWPRRRLEGHLACSLKDARGTFQRVLTSRWIIRIPAGEYRPRVLFCGPRMGPDEAEENRKAWFFASCEIRNLDPVAVAAALQLRAQTTGMPQFYEVWRIDRQAADQLAMDLDLAVRAGKIRFERIPERAPPPPPPLPAPE